MNINKKLCLIALCALFTTFFITSFNGPKKEDIYKKKFIVDREKNNVKDYIKPDEDGVICKPFFAPNADIQGLLVGLMKKEQLSMRITIYSLRDAEIYKTILESLKRGIKVEIVFDAKFEKDLYEKKLVELEAKGASVFVFKAPEKPREDITGIMHNKYVIFEKNIYGGSLLWSGSCNFTSSSHRLNQENIFVVNYPHSIEQYAGDFENLKKNFCRPYEMNGVDDDYVDYAKEGRAGKKRKREAFEGQIGLALDKVLEPPKKKRKLNPVAKACVIGNVLQNHEQRPSLRANLS